MHFDSPRPLGELVEVVATRFRAIEGTILEGRDEVQQVLGLMAQVVGDPATPVTGLAAVDEISGGELAFAGNTKTAHKALAAGAGAVAVKPDTAQGLTGRGNLVVTGYPKLVLTTLLGRFFKPESIPGQPLASYPGVVVGPYVSAGEDVEIGAGTVIHARVSIGRRCRIGRDCLIHPGVTLYDDVVIGNRCVLHSGVVVGAEGFGYEQVGYVQQGGRTAFINVPHAHVGGVVIEDDVELGALTCVDRGLMADTVIGAGTKTDNQVQVAHNCRVGRDVILAAQVGIAGSVDIGDCAVFFGKAGSIDGVRVGRDAVFLGRSGVSKDIPDGRGAYAGFPAIPNREYLRRQATLDRYYKLLPEMAKKLDLKP